MDRSLTSDIYNYRPVGETISTAGQPTEAQLASVARDGFQVVVNLALHNDPRYSLRDEPGLVASLGMEYIHIPVDFEAPQETDFIKFIAAMEKHQGEKMFLHCAANMRVSAFWGLYCVIKLNQSKEHAFNIMKTIWEPDPVWESFIASSLAKYHGQP